MLPLNPKDKRPCPPPPPPASPPTPPEPLPHPPTPALLLLLFRGPVPSPQAGLPCLLSGSPSQLAGFPSPEAGGLSPEPSTRTLRFGLRGVGGGGAVWACTAALNSRRKSMPPTLHHWTSVSPRSPLAPHSKTKPKPAKSASCARRFLKISLRGISGPENNFLEVGRYRKKVK